MNTDWTGRGWVDTLAASLTALLSNLIEAVFGPRVRTPIVGTLEAVDLGVALCFVLMTWLVSWLAMALIRRRSRAHPGPSTPGNWRVEAVRKLGGPLRLMIGMYGLVFVATPLLLRLPGGAEPHVKWQVFDRVFELGVFIAFIWLCLNATHVVEALFKARAVATPGKWNDLIVPHLCRTLRVLGPVVGVIFAVPMLGLPPESEGLRGILVIGVVAYVLFRAVHLGEKVVLARYDITAADNLQARKVYTQVHVLSRTIYVLIAIFTVASVLMLLRGSAAVRHEHSGLRRRVRRHHRFRGPADDREFVCRLPIGHDAAHSTRRRGDCRRRVGADRGDDAHLRGGADLG